MRVQEPVRSPTLTVQRSLQPGSTLKHRDSLVTTLGDHGPQVTKCIVVARTALSGRTEPVEIARILRALVHITGHWHCSGEWFALQRASVIVRRAMYFMENMQKNHSGGTAAPR